MHMNTFLLSLASLLCSSCFQATGVDAPDGATHIDASADSDPLDAGGADTGPFDAAVDGADGCPEGFDAHEGHCLRWTQAPPPWPRLGVHTATLLEDQRVLFVGPLLIHGEEHATHALFDPSDESWTLFHDPRLRREGHTATRLRDGRVLIVGGDEWAGFGEDIEWEGLAQSPSVMLFDPTTQSFTNAASPAGARAFHAAFLMENGRVLVAGGRGENGEALNTLSIYDSTTDQWTPGANMVHARLLPTLSQLSSVVLVAGGHEGPATSEIYDASTDTWLGEDLVGTALTLHTATELTDGSVLMVSQPSGAIRRSLYSHWYRTPDMAMERSGHLAVKLSSREVLILGGDGNTELYDSDLDRWVELGHAPTTITSAGHTATRLSDGRILVGGAPMFFLELR